MYKLSYGKTFEKNICFSMLEFGSMFNEFGNHFKPQDPLILAFFLYFSDDFSRERLAKGSRLAVKYGRGENENPVVR